MRTASLPIIDDQCKLLTLKLVDRIAAEILAQRVEHSRSIFLADGLSGQALFIALAAKTLEKESWSDYVRKAADFVISLLSEQPVRPDLGLFTGLTGTIWALDLALTTLGAQSGAETICDEIDDIAIEYVSAGTLGKNFDLISGLAGIGIFALQRLENGRGAALAQVVVDSLAEISEHDGLSTSWRTIPSLIPAGELKDRSPEGCFNLGLAHGVPGVIAFLAECLARKVAIDRAGPLLVRAMHWLLATEKKADFGSGFPAWLEDKSGIRQAWCYGDPGVALAIDRAASGSGLSDWATCATRITGRLSREVSLDHMGVVDAGLCHGSSGLSHVFAKLYWRSGNPALATAALRMHEHTLRYCSRPETEPPFWTEPDLMGNPFGLGFLTGATGVGLGALAMCDGQSSSWNAPLAVGLD